jgi:hypothetical protein
LTVKAGCGITTAGKESSKEQFKPQKNTDKTLKQQLIPNKSLTQAVFLLKD